MVSDLLYVALSFRATVAEALVNVKLLGRFSAVKAFSRPHAVVEMAGNENRVGGDTVSCQHVPEKKATD